MSYAHAPDRWEKCCCRVHAKSPTCARCLLLNNLNRFYRGRAMFILRHARVVFFPLAAAWCLQGLQRVMQAQYSLLKQSSTSDKKITGKTYLSIANIGTLEPQSWGLYTKEPPCRSKVLVYATTKKCYFLVKTGTFGTRKSIHAKNYFHFEWRHILLMNVSGATVGLGKV